MRLALPQPHEDLRPHRGRRRPRARRDRRGGARAPRARVRGAGVGRRRLATEREGARRRRGRRPDLAGTAVALLRELLYRLATEGRVPAACEVLSAAGPARRSRCPTSTGATASRSAASRRSISTSGVISPGGVGYDINCGVRLLASRLDARGGRAAAARTRGPALPRRADRRRRARRPALGGDELRRVVDRGRALGGRARLRQRDDDLGAHRGGRLLAGADPARSRERARQRGADQLGTLGSGNHFLEVGYGRRDVRRGAAAERSGLSAGQVTIMIHCGSRGLGLPGLRRYLAAS